MKFDFDLHLGFYGQHSFAWRASTAPFEELRALAKVAISSGNFAALTAWAAKRRAAHDERCRALCVEVTPEMDSQLCGLINALRPLALFKRQEKPPPVSLAGLQVWRRDWNELVEGLRPLQPHGEPRRG